MHFKTQSAYTNLKYLLGTGLVKAVNVFFADSETFLYFSFIFTVIYYFFTFIDIDIDIDIGALPKPVLAYLRSIIMVQYKY